jgi:hypothetical protein
MEKHIECLPHRAFCSQCLIIVFVLVVDWGFVPVATDAESGAFYTSHSARWSP